MSDLPPQLKPEITVQDAVHGRIWLTALEHEVISTAEFQRLRHIGQLGLAESVFRTARHSRLAHSLGATHVMGWMLRQPALQEYFRDRPELIPLLRLAALLHDLGHYPFSHLGENVYGGVEYGALGDYGPACDLTVFDVAAQIRRHSAASHERLTAKVIRGTRVGEIIDRNLGEVDGCSAVDVLIDIIEGTYFDSVCHSLISSELDCDRLDYLVRDSGAAGMAYGQVDLAYLVENLRVEDHSRYGPLLAVDYDHGLGAVEHYLHARYFHYARFITHKTIASAELLLAVVMLELIRLEKLPPTANAVLETVGTEEFLGLTDATVWARIYHATTDPQSSDELREAAESLVQRTLLKCAISLEALEDQDEEPYEQIRLDKLFENPAAKRKVAEAAGVPDEAFCYKRASLRLTGIPARIKPKPGDEERLEWLGAVNVARRGEEPEPAVMQRGLLGHLSTNRWVTRRVFVREPSFTASIEPEGRENTSKLAAYLAEETAR